MSILLVYLELCRARRDSHGVIGHCGVNCDKLFFFIVVIISFGAHCLAVGGIVYQDNVTLGGRFGK